MRRGGEIPLDADIEVIMSNIKNCDVHVAADKQWKSGTVQYSIVNRPRPYIVAAVQSNNEDILLDGDEECVCTCLCNDDKKTVTCSVENGAVKISLPSEYIYEGAYIKCELRIEKESNDDSYTYRTSLFDVIVIA